MKTIPAFFLDPKKLEGVAREKSAAYAAAKPFPHIVLDHFFEHEILDHLLAEFPSGNEIPWGQYHHEHSKKWAVKEEALMGDFTRYFIYHLNSSIFMDFLGKLTGIEGLIPDPYLWGGGLHRIERGGYLGIHADFNTHPKLQLERRLNLLLYLNKDWKEEYGGHLELWDKGMTGCVKKVLPVFNRCVIFSTTDFSYHGHPHPLTCPEGVSRKSLALYYYTSTRPVKERSAPHSTLYQKRPSEKSPKISSLKKNLKKLIPLGRKS